MPTRAQLSSVILGGLSTVMLLAFLFFPRLVIDAALRGVSIWWDVLFPALFPFFVISELLLGIGVVHFVGTLLDPFMRPLFRISGKGGFVMAMGFAAGYPVGARLTARLRLQKSINRDEGERLVAYTTTADPIFLIGAVSVGFFHDPALALVLAVAHYVGAIAIGAIMRFHGKEPPAAIEDNGDGKSLFARAMESMRRARMEDGRPLGQMFAEAVESAIRLVFVVGGLVVFFCVFIDLLQILGAMDWIASAAAALLSLFGTDHSLSDALVNGLFEVTLGAKAAAAAGVSYKEKAAVAAFVLSWAGLSVHAQIVSLLSNTGFRYWPFMFARALHALFSMMIVYSTWEALYPAAQTFASNPAFAQAAMFVLPERSPTAYSFILYAAFALLLFGTATILLGLGLLVSKTALRHVRQKRRHP